MVDIPTLLVATAVSSTRIDLAWQNQDHYDSVKIYRKPSGGSYSLVHTTGYDAESWSNTGLSPAVTYYYYVKGVIGVETSAASNIAYATTVFDPPQAVEATAVNGHRIDIAWSEPAGVDYDSVEVYRKLAGGSYSKIATTAAASPYLDTTVLEGRPYYHKLRGKLADLYSGYSNEGYAITPLPAPTSLVGILSGGATSATLTWVINSVDEQGFKVYKNGVLAATVGAGVDGYLLSGLTPGVSYSITVKAYAGSIFSSASNAVTLETLPGPTGLDGYSNAAGTQAVLSWNDNSPNEDSFKVYMDGALIHTTAANATTYTKTGLIPGSWHTFYVRAYAADLGYSAYSNTLELLMADPPAKPTLATAIAVSTTAIRLSWQDNANNEIDFHIERSATSAVTGFSEIATVGANVKTYEDTGRTTNTQYWYRVRAHNAGGYSGYSNVATAVTWAAIAAPTNLALMAAKVGGAYGVEVTFDDNSELEDSHIIERAEMGAVEMLTDGGFENWASATNLTSWTEVVTGASTVNREATEKHGGTYAVRFDVDASNSACYIYQTVTLVASGLYRVSLWYKTAAGKTMRYMIRDSASNVWLQADGTWGAEYFHVLSSATWAQDEIYFTAHPSYTSYWFQITRHGATSSSIYIDDAAITGESAGDYAELVTLAPNRTYYHDATVAAGTTYAYRVRAKQGAASYSGYCDPVSITVPDVPAAPANFKIAGTPE